MANTNEPKITAVIERVCVRFETELLCAPVAVHPIETCLGEVPEQDRCTCSRELLELEVECQLRSGRTAAGGGISKTLSHPHSDIVGSCLLQARAPAVRLRSLIEGDPGAIQLTLTVIDGPDKGHVFTFAGHDVFLAGRSKQTALQLNDPYSSRYHFMIEINPPLCRLADMGSRGGTSVNDKVVKSADLPGGGVQFATGLRTALRVAVATPKTEQNNDVSDALTLLPGVSKGKGTDENDPESTQASSPAPPMSQVWDGHLSRSASAQSVCRRPTRRARPAPGQHQFAGVRIPGGTGTGRHGQGLSSQASNGWSARGRQGDHRQRGRESQADAASSMREGHHSLSAPPPPHRRDSSSCSKSATAHSSSWNMWKARTWRVC